MLYCSLLIIDFKILNKLTCFIKIISISIFFLYFRIWQRPLREPFFKRDLLMVWAKFLRNAYEELIFLVKCILMFSVFFIFKFLIFAVSFERKKRKKKKKNP